MIDYKPDLKALEADGKLVSYISDLIASHKSATDNAEKFVLESTFAEAIKFLLEKAVELESVNGTGEIKYGDNAVYKQIADLINASIPDGLLVKLIEILEDTKEKKEGYCVHQDLAKHLMSALGSSERTYSDALILRLIDLCEVSNNLRHYFDFFNSRVSDFTREVFESKLIKECKRWKDESNMVISTGFLFEKKDLPDRIILKMLDYYREHEFLGPICGLLEVRPELSVTVKKAVEDLIIELAPRCALRGDVKNLITLLERDDLSSSVKDAIKSELPNAIRSCEVAGNIGNVLDAYKNGDNGIKSLAEAALPNTLRNAGKRADVDNLCFFYFGIPESMKSIAEDALIEGLTKALAKTEGGDFSAFERVIKTESIPDFVKVVSLYLLSQLEHKKYEVLHAICDLLSEPNAPRQLKNIYTGPASIQAVLELVGTIVRSREDIKTVLDAKIKPPRKDAEAERTAGRRPAR